MRQVKDRVFQRNSYKYLRIPCKEGGGNMRKPNIVSYIKINGEWVDQKDIPPEIVMDIVEKVIKRAASTIGFEAARISKEKNA